MKSVSKALTELRSGGLCASPYLLWVAVVLFFSVLVLKHTSFVFCLFVCFLSVFMIMLAIVNIFGNFMFVVFFVFVFFCFFIF